MRSNRQKTIITRLALGILIVAAALLVEFVIHRYTSNRAVVFRTEKNRFLVSREDKWHDFIVKGVNLGEDSENGLNGVSKAQYALWFREIAAMNANVITVNSVLPPDFYRAFFEYNLLAEKPLYLLHGIRMDGESIRPNSHVYDERVNSRYREAIKNTIDVVHGNATMKLPDGNTLGYKLNVAPYVMGYILGGTMDAEHVIFTNEKNTHVMGFEGDYLYTANASPYEAWLAAVGNYAVSYEQDTYSGPFRLISWINLPATDPIAHAYSSEGRRNRNNEAAVDFEHIRPTRKFSGGIFASYNVSRNYPDIASFRPDDKSLVADGDVVNPYEVYMASLRRHHTMPVMEAAFTGQVKPEPGLSAAEMFDSIINAGFTGGIMFNWQDDWLREAYTFLQEKFAEY